MEPKVISGLGISSLMDLLQGGRDEEHDKIITAVSDETSKRLTELAGGNPLARRYVQDIWRKIIGGLTKGKHPVPTDEEVTIKILRIIADSFEMRNRLHNELLAKRENAQKTPKLVVDKDVQ